MSLLIEGYRLAWLTGATIQEIYVPGDGSHATRINE